MQASIAAGAHLSTPDVFPDAQVNGSVRYNGVESKDFVIRRTAGLVEQGGLYFSLNNAWMHATPCHY